ncbi:MAG TPA: hypothetical protein VHU40_03280, partial [Polyangia bacterium]|nr:hypothetical protein [Polyangia bacterium]
SFEHDPGRMGTVETPGALAQALTELDAVELGFVLGALLAGAGDDPTFAAGLPAASRERCGQALAAIAGLPRAERVRVTGLLASIARAGLPAGIEGVHPDHLHAALCEESLPLVRRLQSTWRDEVPLSIRTATARWISEQVEAERPDDPPPTSGEADPELMADVLRSVFAGLAEVPGPWQGAPPRRLARQLALMEPGTLLSTITAEDPRRFGARLAREEAHGLGTHALLMAVAQRLPASVARAFLEDVAG